jgi:O-antigen ligase
MKKQSNNIATYFLLPIALIVLIVPLIVHMREVPISTSAIAFWKGGDKDFDFFSSYKSMWFLGLTIVGALTLVIKLSMSKFKIKKSIFYIPMGVYALFAILSSLLSKEGDVSLTGFPNRYEGIWILLAYMLVMFIVINMLENEKHIKMILGGLLISSTVIGLIAVFQYFNMDLFQTTFGKKLMLPFEKWGMVDQLNFQLGPRAAYGTLYHTNYVGSFTAMILPLALGMFLFFEDKKYKIGAGLLTLLMFASLMASHSRAGITGAIFAVALILIIARKKLVPNAAYVAVLAVVIVLTGFGINNATKGQVTEQIGTLYNDSAPSVTATAGVKDVAVTKELISLSDGTDNLKISYKNGKIKTLDTNDKTVAFTNDPKSNKIGFSDPRYSAYTLTILSFQKQPVLEITKGSFKIDFIVTPVGYKLYEGHGNALDITAVESWGFKGNENLGSARGYIWSRSLPLLKKTVITGFGPDTFAIHFPQNDYIGKFLAYNDATIIVDKPHNIYLQAAVNTGVVSLLALLALFIMYFVLSMKVFIKNEFKSMMDMAGAGIFVAVCGYLVAGLFNDSTVSVAPVFWVLLGVGISINMILSAKKPVK